MEDIFKKTVTEKKIPGRVTQNATDGRSQGCREQNWWGRANWNQMKVEVTVEKKFFSDTHTYVYIRKNYKT